MRHEDHLGNVGLRGSGGVQWMTAARGIIHSEMPEQESGAMRGFQLWLNLPAKDELGEPGYRDIAAADIPRVTTAGGVELHDVEAQTKQFIRYHQEIELTPAQEKLRVDALSAIPAPCCWRRRVTLRRPTR